MPSVPTGQEIVGPEDEIYTLVDFLGRGAFGEVYRAINTKTGAVVAVKLLALGKVAEEVDRRALLNEIKIARQINHPNVVRVLHVNEGTIPEVGPYACMEYVTGGTLASLLRAQRQAGSPIPVGRDVEMMIDIAQGARAINEKIIHRDIKPDNILIEGKTLKIGDFGISKFVDESTRLQTFKGGQHVAYMAPEGWTNDKNTYKLDVYAVGLVFFEILTLKHPLLPQVPDPTNFLDWQKAHLYGSYPDIKQSRADTPLPLIQLLPRMIAKRPQERPDWNEAIEILSNPASEIMPTTSKAIQSAVKAAVTSAIEKRQTDERERLKLGREREEREREFALYLRSCSMLLDQLQPTVDEFNQAFQAGGIVVNQQPGTGTPPKATYVLPTGVAISVAMFWPKKTAVTIRGGLVIGGGLIGLSVGRSASLVLLKEGENDLYGRWIVCEIAIMALVNARTIIGRFGIKESTVIPFGFTAESDFYEQISYASGGMHIFTYQFNDRVSEFFATLIELGCRPSLTSRP